MTICLVKDSQKIYLQISVFNCAEKSIKAVLNAVSIEADHKKDHLSTHKHVEKRWPLKEREEERKTGEESCMMRKDGY